ncbi:MAG: DoxX family protein [Planctomycetia bacterium]|nr:DoxX family protein [Planctomycetia bacterium]
MQSCDAGCKLKDLGLLAMRLMLAVVFVYHGGQKVFGWFTPKPPAAAQPADAAQPAPPVKTPLEEFAGHLEAMKVPQPKTAAIVSAWTELAGGVLLGIGFLSRLAAIPMAFNMYVAAFVAHAGAFGLFNFDANGKLKPGMEYALTLAVFLTGLVLTGPGHLSLDGLLFRRRSREVEPAAKA